MCSRERAWAGSFVLRVFTCFLKAGILEEDLNKIFTSFLGVSFNMLIHQNEHVRSGLWSLLIGQCLGRGSLIIASGPDGIALYSSAFLGVELKHN